MSGAWVEVARGVGRWAPTPPPYEVPDDPRDAETDPDPSREGDG